MDEARERGGRRPLAFAEALLCLGLIFTPLALGTVQWWSLAVVIALSFGAAFAAGFARPRHLPWPVLVAAMVSAWVGLQALPLPPAVYRVLSPNAASIIGFVVGDPGWRSLSLDPSATAREFARLSAYTAVFFAASRLVASRSTSRERLARVIVASTAAQCVLVVAHHVIATDKIYGLVSVRTAGLALGSFGNGNHFAAYLTLGIAMAVGLALKSEGTARRYYCAVAVAASLMIILTISRSGIAGLIVLCIGLCSFGGRGGIGANERRLILAGLAAALVLLIALAAFGAGGGKLDTLSHPLRLLGEEKVMVWRDIPRLVRDYWATGIGRGAFEQIFPMYKVHADSMTFTHVECAPLQLLADLGVIVGGICIIAWVASLVGGVRGDPSILRAAAVAALAAVSVHDLGDYSLDACGAVGFAAAVLWGLVVPSGHRSMYVTVKVQLGGVAAVAALAGVALFVGWRDDLYRDLERVEIAARDTNADLEPLVKAAIPRHPTEPWFPFMAGVDRVRHHDPKAALRYLNHALALDPQSARTHQVVGDALFQLGRNRQALLEYRFAWESLGYSDEVLRALDVHRGIRFVDKMETLAGDDPTRLRDLAGFMDRSGYLADAALAATRLTKLHPDDPDAHLVLAHFAFSRGKYEEVLNETASLRANPDVALLSARALDELGRPGEADALLSLSNAEQPTVRTTMAIAARAIARRQPAEALTVLEKMPLTDLDQPTLGQFYLLRGKALEQKGRERDAILDLTTAGRIDPSEANQIELGAAYERAGLLRAALLAYREAARTSQKPSQELAQRLAHVKKALGVDGPTMSGGGVGGSSFPVEATGAGDESDTGLEGPAEGKAAAKETEEDGERSTDEP